MSREDLGGEGREVPLDPFSRVQVAGTTPLLRRIGVQEVESLLIDNIHLLPGGFRFLIQRLEERACHQIDDYDPAPMARVIEEGRGVTDNGAERNSNLTILSV